MYDELQPGMTSCPSASITVASSGTFWRSRPTCLQESGMILSRPLH